MKVYFLKNAKIFILLANQLMPNIPKILPWRTISYLSSRTVRGVISLFSCFSCICLFVLYVLVFVIFLFLLVSGVGCGLWLWHSLNFSINFFQYSIAHRMQNNVVTLKKALLILDLAHLSAPVCASVYELNRRKSEKFKTFVILRFPDSCRIIYVEFRLFSIDWKYPLIVPKA